MHFLSLQMEPILHNGCPHNCEDLISWLPFDIATRVLSYLDPGTLLQYMFHDICSRSYTCCISCKNSAPLIWHPFATFWTVGLVLIARVY